MSAKQSETPDMLARSINAIEQRARRLLANGGPHSSRQAQQMVDIAGVLAALGVVIAKQLDDGHIDAGEGALKLGRELMDAALRYQATHPRFPGHGAN